MTNSATIRHRAWTLARLARPSLFPAVIAAAVVFTGGYFFKEQNRQNFQSELKSNVESELILFATRLQSEFNNIISALRGLRHSLRARGRTEVGVMRLPFISPIPARTSSEAFCLS